MTSHWAHVPTMRLLLPALMLVAAFAPRAEAQELEWREEWNAPTLQHGIITGGLAIGALSLSLLEDTHEGAWMAPNGLDEAFYEAFTASSPRGRRIAGIFSDITRTIAITPPLLLDPLLAYRDNEDVGRYVLQISTLSMAVGAFSLTLLKYFVRRERPLGRHCLDDDDNRDCGPRRYRSWPSGHALMAFTGASLTCTLHPRLPIYRSRAAGIAACSGAMVAATITSLLRITARKHYFTDILTGAVIGALAGWLLPTALNFAFHRD